MEENILGKVGRGEKESGGCYREESEVEKEKSENVKIFCVLFLMFVSLLGATIELRSRYSPQISSF